MCYNISVMGDEVVKMSILEFVDIFINDKLEQNEEFIRITFYEIRIKHNLTDEQTDEFLKFARNKLENRDYKVYFTDAKFEYDNARRTVQPNELMIAIKNYEKEDKNGRKIK